MDRAIDGQMAARVWELEKELAKYLSHQPSCARNGTGKCSCGLSQARHSFREIVKKMLRALGEME